MVDDETSRACGCWLLPTQNGVAPLAVLAQSRRVRLSLNDGLQLEGELDWANQRRGSSVDQVLELTDEHGVTLVELDEVATIEVCTPPMRAHHLVAMVTECIDNWRDLTPGEQQYLDLVVGDHELLEVTVKRTRLACMPVRAE